MCREWTEDGQLWVQYVSSTPATRLDVINLQEKLDQQLQQRQVGCSPCVLADLRQLCRCLLHMIDFAGTRDGHLPHSRGAVRANL